MVATINHPDNFKSDENQMWNNLIELDDINQISYLCGLIVDNLPDFIWIKDDQGKFVYANKSFLHFLELKNLDECKGKSDETFIELVKFKNKIKKCSFDFSFEDVNVDTPNPIKKQIIGTIDSDLFALDIQKTPIVNKNKTIIGYAYWGRNISELYKQIKYRFKTEQDLTETKLENFKIVDFNNAIIHNVDAFIYVKDKNGKFISANKKFYDYFKTDELCIKGCTDFDFYLKDMAITNSRIDKIVMELNQTISSMEEDFVDYTGQVHHMLTSKTPLHSEDGSVIGLVGISFNIDKQKEIEAKLQFSNSVYCGTLNSVPDGIIITTSDGSISDCNVGCEKMFGYNSTELKKDMRNIRFLFNDPVEYDQNGHFNCDYNHVDLIDAKRKIVVDGHITTESFPCEYNSYTFMAGGCKMICHWISDRTTHENMKRQLEEQKNEMLNHYTTIIVESNKKYAHLFNDSEIEIKIDKPDENHFRFEPPIDCKKEELVNYA